MFCVMGVIQNYVNIIMEKLIFCVMEKPIHKGFEA